MENRDLHRLLRLSVEASPEAPVEAALEPPASPPPAPTPPAEDRPTAPVCALTPPEDTKAMSAGLKAKANPAEWTFERLCRMIEDFESKLSAEEEVGATIVGAPGEGAFHVDDIGFWGPDLIMFYGKNVHGRGVRLIQHYQQLSVLLTALPRQQPAPARRIGFALRNRMEEAAAGDAPPPRVATREAVAPPPIAKPPRGAERP